MATSAPFSSECPNCRNDRLLSGYSPEELGQLLAAGAEIEAYCASCDERWPISVEERADIARALTKRTPR
jgi:redox-regulated HSP33 family molecular chaperone